MADILKTKILPGETSAQSALGAILVIFGVVLKNSMEQLKMGDSKLGVLAFVAGWVLFANAVATSANNQATSRGGFGTDINVLLPYVAGAAIVFSVFSMKMVKKGTGSMADKQKRMLPYLAGFVVGWILLGYSLNAYRLLSAISVGIVLLSMIFFLPKQRKNCVVDGPGLPLFVLGWLGLVLANSNGTLSFPDIL